MRTIEIQANDSNQRLDKFLIKLLPAMPKSMLYKSLRKNCVRVNGKHIRDGAYILSEGEELSLYLKDEFFTENTKQISQNSDIDVVFEDENILVVNKPRGLLSHSGGRDSDNTLIDRIQSYLYKSGSYDPAAEQTFSPALCNRLDRNTSGLVIAAKNAAALRFINEKIKNREIKKYYLCVTDVPPDPPSSELTAYLTRGDKIVSVSDKQGDKQIKTRYKLLRRLHKGALVEIELLTGRTHQIRAQMANIGCPLSGDVKYGGSRQKNGYKLCSFKLIFDFEDDGEFRNLSNLKLEIKPTFTWE